ncbi:MAG: hypothetical protein KA270_13935 [Saprospiraceae bacterium]|nr:hypothetical protein [Saprospiraceae bacterium]MBP6568266.1 hypothetical protein [Saprospiraceae bacterium]
MRFLFVFLIFTTFRAVSQNSETISWDVTNTIENISGDSSEIEMLTTMSSMLRSKTKMYLKGNMLVSIATYDSLNQTRSVNINGENHAHLFFTLDGVTMYKKQYLEDLNANDTMEPLRSDEVPPAKFIGNKQVGPFNCVVNEISIPEKNIRIKTTSTHDIKISTALTNTPLPIPGLENIGTILDMEMDLVFYKMVVASVNFTTGPVDTSVFSISTEGISELDWLGEMKWMKLMMGSNFPDEKKEEIPLGDGDNNDLYLKMCEDGNMSMCDIESLDLMPSFDKTKLMSYVKTYDLNTYQQISKKEIDEIFLKYNLLTKDELTSFNKTLKKLDENLDGSAYSDLVLFLKEKKMLETKEFREILITNLAKNNFKSKNENHPEAKDFINGIIDWKTFLSSYQGIYDLKFKKIVNNENDFLNEIKTILNTISPILTISINDNKEIEITKDNLTISYKVETEYSIIDAKYDDEGNRIKSNKTRYDFESYSKYGMLNMFRQIGADFDLELVFDFINANSVLFHNQYEDKYKEIHLFDGDLFLCIDKVSSGESFGKDIPFTKKDYHEERDKLTSIKAFYASNPGITYIPLYKKEKLFHLINENRSTFGLDSLFDANNWFTTVKNQLFDNLGSFIQSVPKFGVIVSTSASNGTTYNESGKSYESIFPNLQKLFGNDFQPKDLDLKIDELDAEMTFKYLDNNYTLNSSLFELEDDFLKKIIELLKENNLYKSKRVYQSIENLSDYKTKRLFYIPIETYKILTDEFELMLMDYSK